MNPLAPLDDFSTASSSFKNSPSDLKLEVKDLEFSYGNRKVLKNLSLEVRKGEILGILAPNGAGKTTLFHLLTGIFPTPKGKVFLDGNEISPKNPHVRKNIGVIFQEPSLDKKLTAMENLLLSASLYRIPKIEAKNRASKFLRIMDLEDRAFERVETFSGGMRRRLELIRALIHQPTFLILDEPTTGLDEKGFQSIWQTLKQIQKQSNLTILLNTHRSEEGELCDRLLILHEGSFIANDTPKNLKSQIKGDVIIIDTLKPHLVMETLHQKFSIQAKPLHKNIHFEIKEGEKFIPQLVHAFPSETFQSISLHRPTLADVFIHLTGKSLEEESNQSS